MRKQNKKINNQQIIERKSRKHYSFLAFVLIVCIIELGVSVTSNFNKNINFMSKIKGLEKKHNEEMIKNEQLKSQIKNFDSEAILESITRNNLKMAGENEILVIIHNPGENNTNDKNDNKI